MVANASTALPNQSYLVDKVRDQLMVYDSSCIGGSFAQGESTATEVRDVDAGQLTQFITGVLGYSVAGNGNGGITRFLPKQHPSAFYLWASRVGNIQGIAPQGMFTDAHGENAKWKTYRVTIQYETPLYQVLKDGEVIGAAQSGETTTQEWRRFTIWSMEPSVEFIQLRNGVFEYDPTTLPTGSLQANNRRVVANYGQQLRLSKVKITANWIQVPDAGLFPGGSSVSIYAANQINGLGCVNYNLFMGQFKPGTLRFDGFKPQARVMPTTPNQTVRPIAWDVQMTFTYFEPPKGEFIPIGDGTDYGHNLIPLPTNGLWYPSYVNGSTSWPRYQTYDFEKIFKLNS